MFKKKDKIDKSVSKKTTVKDDIFENGKDWEASKRESLISNLRTTRILVFLLSATTIVSVLAIILMMPLKTIQLEIIKVDNSTGIVEVLEQQKEFKSNYDETINTYFLKKYVRYRDGYSYPLMSEYYNYVGILSTPTEQQNYARWFNPDNIDSPLNVLGRKKKAIVKFKSVSFLKDDVALVRFVREIKEGDKLLKEEHLQATIVFKYVKSSISTKDKEINPLGFQVVEYRLDEESGN